MHLAERLAGRMLGGAIGDAWGSGFENLPKQAAARTPF
jgi:ADP-ribosylglycohydrolase